MHNGRRGKVHFRPMTRFSEGRLHYYNCLRNFLLASYHYIYHDVDSVCQVPALLLYILSMGASMGAWLGRDCIMRNKPDAEHCAVPLYSSQ